MKQGKRIIAFLLALSLTMGINAVPILAEDAVLEISTPEEFLTFSQMCRYDAYSEGLTVCMTADIDMTGLSFAEIPIFLGDFDGGGYTISGIGGALEKDGQGLFRYISEGAMVSNLTVYTTIKTEHNIIGGIAAENYGTIKNCRYRGVISGMDAVGGIAGANYGTILNSISSGSVFGETQVGGIAGINEGSILQCYNYGEINTDISNFTFTVEDKLVSNINPNSDTINIANIGGIAGNSEGMIQSCTNHGMIGYPHVGYNIGGIAGIQSGYVANCFNTGFVQGRKEVGGIVGQFEPHVDTVYSLSKLQSLRDQLDVFGDLTSTLADDVKSSNTLVSDVFLQLGDSVEEGKENVEKLMEQTGDVLDENIDSVNEISVTVADTLDALSPIVNSFGDVIDELEDSADDFEGMAEELGDALEELEDLEDVGDSLTSGRSNLQSGLNYLRVAANQLENVSPDLTSITTVLQNMAYYIEYGLEDMVSAYDDFQEVLEVTTVLRKTNNDVQDAVYYLECAFHDIGDAMEYLEDTNVLVSDLVDDLADRDEVVFTKFDEDYDETKDALSDSLTQIGDDFSMVNTAVSASGDLLVDDLDDVIQQITDIFDLVLEMMQDVTSFVEDEAYKIEDVSIIDTSEIFTGKVTDCNNTGAVEGDINIGGIAGGISFELSFDMEDDWKTDGDKTQTIKRQGVAVIENTVNTGDVTAKKDGAGGILGYQDFGLVQNCTVAANVESLEGDYIGGIVGQSNGYIRGCFSKTTLQGGQFAGGVVGSGYDIQECYSISSITATKGGFGGIVGELATDGILKRNFFVSDTLGGLDGISFRGMAESISYEDLLLVEGIPDLFQTMSVSFCVEDDLVQTIAVDFGDTLSVEEFPIMPTKEGYFSQWEDVDTTNIQSDLKLNGAYYPILTTIAGTKNADGVPIILVDGSFTDAERLMVEQNEMEYTIWVEGEQKAIKAIRYLMPEENITIQLQENGKWKNANAVVDGKYSIIPVSSSEQVQFRVVTMQQNKSKIFVFIGVLGVVLVLCIVGKRKKQDGISSAHNS